MNIVKYDLHTGSPIKLFEGYSLHLTCMTLDNTNPGRPQQYLYTGHNDSSVREWDTNEGTLTRLFTGHTSSVYYIAHTGDRLFTMQYNYNHQCGNSVFVWDVASGHKMATVRGESGIVSFMQASGDGQRL